MSDKNGHKSGYKKMANLGDKGIGRTWEKFSSLPAKKPRKFETATGKENFSLNRGRISGR